MMSLLERTLLTETWHAVADTSAPPAIDVEGPAGGLPSAFPALETAVACVGTALLAGARSQPVSLSRPHVAAAMHSQRFFRVAGHPPGRQFAPLSRFWRTTDGWLRTHGNYPWHREALLRAVGAPEDPAAVAAAMAVRGSEDLEQAIVDAGGVAGVVRPRERWAAHPHGVAVTAEPLVAHDQIDGAPPRSTGGRVRVLDLTRVIAGPVCTRFLGLLGADVLRIDPPHRPDLPADEPADSLLAKRSAMLDFGADSGAVALRELLASADVVVSGYRPGALDAFGLSVGDLTTDHPGLVVVLLNAWGHTGPWRKRRGFDSVVQAPTGIAVGESADGTTPGTLPCQLLDHGTGYLAAAAALDGLRRQRAEGGTHVRRLSLARTAWWLTSRTRPEPGPGEMPPPPESFAAAVDTEVSAISPPGIIGGRALCWPSVGRYGAASAQWA